MEALGIDPKLLLAQLINFALFGYLFKKFLWSSYQKFVSAEKTQLQKLSEVEKVVAEKHENAQISAKKTLDEASSQAQEILSNAKNSAKELAYQENKKLELELAKRQNDFVASQEKEQLALRSELRNQTSKLASTLAARALTNTLSAQDQKRINDQIIKELEKMQI